VNLILASQSPQRKKILKMMGLDFKVIPANIDEHNNGFVRPHAIVKSIANRKATTIAKKHPGKWIIGCDTIVALSGGDIAVKPKDRKDARRILKTYRDSYCDVYSGLSLVNTKSAESYNDYEHTRIIFCKFSKKQLEDYLNTGDWKGRSGAMTIEGSGDWIKRIDGEYWNVVGLPVDLLKKMLKKAGLV